MTYACFEQQMFSEGDFQLVPLRHKDIFKIKEWRNAQMPFLRQNEPLSDEQQENYYKTVIEPSFAAPQPAQILFSFLFQKECIGYGGLVHMDWHSKHGEVSFLLDPQKAEDPIIYQEYFVVFLHLIKQIAFQTLSLHRLYTETFDVRPWHTSILESQGFLFEGRMKEHIFFAGKYIDSLIHGCVHHA